jgi:hypothetical protein
LMPSMLLQLLRLLGLRWQPCWALVEGAAPASDHAASHSLMGWPT